MLPPGIDISDWQAPGSVNFGALGFVIIQASHGVTEDRHWREHFNAVVAAGKPLGLYHFAETADAVAEAHFFYSLVGFLQPDQVHMGFWLDAETGQSEVWVDQFRSTVRLPWCGVYSNLAGYNVSMSHAYDHFALNWLALPAGTQLPRGWTMPDRILTQTGQFAGVDVDEMSPAQPVPPAWVV